MEECSGGVRKFALRQSRHIRAEPIDVLEIFVDEHRYHVAGTAFEHDFQEGPPLSFLQVQQLG